MLIYSAALKSSTLQPTLNPLKSAFQCRPLYMYYTVCELVYNAPLSNLLVATGQHNKLMVYTREGCRKDTVEDTY